MNTPWKLGKIWNESIDQKEEKPVVARERLWASELGKANIDLYLKLNGEQQSNPFDSRAKRKFEAGNLFEWVVKLMLIRCGIYKASQEYIEHQIDADCLPVTGKLDFVAGGAPDYDHALEGIEELQLPEMFTKATKNILEYFKTNYPNGLPEQIIEVKSTSSYGIEKVYFTGKALAGHDLQAFHYAYKKNLPATILYICRDDLRMAEVPVMPDDEALYARYEAKIRSISKFVKTKTEPEKDPEIVFDEDTVRFTKNFNVEYSSYLTKVYGVLTPDEFNEKWGSKVESWNRVLGRIRDKKELTDNNKEKLAEMVGAGWDVDFIREKVLNQNTNENE